MTQFVLIKTHTFESMVLFNKYKGARTRSRYYLGIGEMADIIDMIDNDFQKEIDRFLENCEDEEPYVSWGNLMNFINQDGVKTYDCFLRSHKDDVLYDEDYTYTAIPTEMTNVQF